MNTRILIPILVAGALAFACGPRSRSDIPVALATAQLTSFAKSTAAPSGRSRRHDNEPKLVAKVDSKLAVNVSGSNVNLALNVANTGNKHVELDFPNGQSYDFVVLDSLGREMWRWSHGRIFTQSVQNKQLGTGESMRVSETWKANQHGKFTAVATLNSTNFPAEQRVEFVLP